MRLLLTLRPRSAGAIAFLAAMAVLARAADSVAQEIPTTPVEQEKKEVAIDVTADDYANLTRLHVAGDWDKFYNHANMLRARISAKCTCMAPRDYVILFWPGTIPAATEPTALWAVIGPSASEPYLQDSSGLNRGFSRTAVGGRYH